MKRILSLLCALPAFAGERYVTVTTNAVLTVASGESLEYVSGLNGSAALHPSGSLPISFAIFPGTWANTEAPKSRAIVAGPMDVHVSIFKNGDGLYTGFGTFRLTPNFADPSKTLVLSPGKNAVTVELQGSTNLVDWSVAASVTLTNVPTATFFRAVLKP